MRPYDRHPFIEAKRLTDLPEVQTALHELIASSRTSRLKAAPATSGALPQHGHALLQAAALHPFTPVARLWEKAGKVPSPEAQIAARKALEAARLAEFEELRISRRNVLLIRILDLGWSFLGRTPPQTGAGGGIGHSSLAVWAAMDARKEGDEAVLEWPVPGTSHIADVMRKRGGEHHVVEIVVTCTSNLKSHLKACFLESDVVATCTIVLLQKAIRDKVRTHLAADPEIAPLLDRVRFEIAQTYLDKEPWQ